MRLYDECREQPQREQDAQYLSPAILRTRSAIADVSEQSGIEIVTAMQQAVGHHRRVAEEDDATFAYVLLGRQDDVAELLAGVVLFISEHRMIRPAWIAGIVMTESPDN